MLDLTVTEASERDLPQLLRLYADLHPEDPPVDPSAAKTTWAEIRTNTNRVVLLAWHHEQAVGSLEYSVWANLTRGARPYVTIENVVVRTDFRRRGIASHMIEVVRDRAKNLHSYKIQLAVDRAGPRAFYEACGFRATGTVMKLDWIEDPR